MQYRIDLSHALAVVVTTGLIVMMSIILTIAVIVGTGMAPMFEQYIKLNVQINW